MLCLPFLNEELRRQLSKELVNLSMIRRIGQNVCFTPVQHLSSVTMSEMCLQLSQQVIYVLLGLLSFIHKYGDHRSLVWDFMTCRGDLLSSFSIHFLCFW